MFKKSKTLLGIGMIAILMTAIMAIAPVIFSSPIIAQQQQAAKPQPRVTSMSQLKDVDPTDPYFPALRDLVEQYGCVSLPPNGKFEADKPLTRGQSAIFVHACLSKMAEAIRKGVLIPDKVNPESVNKS